MGRAGQEKHRSSAERSLRVLAWDLSRRFRGNERGNVAMIVGFATIPLAGMMGLALDYSRVSLGRAELQAAVDSAGLAIAQMPKGTPLSTLQQRAQEWVEASLAPKALGQVTVTVTQEGTALNVKADTSVPTTLFSVIQQQPTALSASNQVVWDIGKVEIALVLDNTGSMASTLGTGATKIASLKEASTKLVSVLRDAVTQPGQVKIGIVPFSSAVNIGSQYRTAPWIAQHQQSSINKQIFWNAAGNANPNRFSLFDAMGVSWAGCVETRPYPYDVQDVPPTTSATLSPIVGDTIFVPFFAPDEPDLTTTSKNGKVTQNFDNNYLPDGLTSTDWKQLQGYDKKYTKAPNPSSLGPNLGCDQIPLLRLSTDLSTTGPVQTKIDAMKAAGDTNIPMGLMWGWHLVSPNAPFADGVAYDTPNVTKYIILMTDGENTYSDATNANNQNQSEYTGLGYVWQRRLGNTTDFPATSTRTDLMNDRLKLLCANLKKEPGGGGSKNSAEPGIQVYSIGVGVNTSTKSLLQNCATKSDMYYDVSNASEMTPVFTRIANEISQLRLSK